MRFLRWCLCGLLVISACSADPPEDQALQPALPDWLEARTAVDGKPVLVGEDSTLTVSGIYAAGTGCSVEDASLLRGEESRQIVVSVLGTVYPFSVLCEEPYTFTFPHLPPGQYKLRTPNRTPVRGA